MSTYTLTITPDSNVHGRIIGAGEYESGTLAYIKAMPADGYTFTKWSDDNTDNPRQITVAADLTLSAVFSPTQTYTITVVSSNITYGAASGGGSYGKNEEVTLTAQPEIGCYFYGWKINDQLVSTLLSYTFKARETVTIIALFSNEEYYRVTAFPSDSVFGGVTVTADQNPASIDGNLYPPDTNITLSAVPTYSGQFLSWQDGDYRTTKSFVLTDDVVIRANFYPSSGLIMASKEGLRKLWIGIKSLFKAREGARSIGVDPHNALGATSVADVVDTIGDAGGLAVLNNHGKINASDIEGTLANNTTGNASTATVADKVGIATVGSTSQPVYMNAGTPVACGFKVETVNQVPVNPDHDTIYIIVS